MEPNVLKEPNFVEEILAIFRSDITPAELNEKISDYHENDIAGALEQMTPEERQKVYPILGAEKVSEIFTYIEDVDKYIGELNIEKAAKVISHMDSDDAVDVLEEMDDSTSEKIMSMLEEDSGRDVRLILSYDDDEIGSKMTTNLIVIKNDLNIRSAMRELVKQAGDNDNIYTIYVVDEEEKFYGAIDLKDLIVARSETPLEDLIVTSYPYVGDHEHISDCIERIKEYAEDSIPVLSDDKKIVGIITSQDIVEVVDDELGDDYAKLAGLTAEEDLNEKTNESMKKRLPWLIILLMLGIVVSTVVGVFEKVVAAIPIVICFQSLILDMAGNAGTQSLAVTIRVLMDETLTARQKIGLAFKEMCVGLCNGLFLGSAALLVIGAYLKFIKSDTLSHSLLIAVCVGGALVLSMIISSLLGTLIPMFFHKIKIDPAVASGPLITTVNDLVAVVAYYGLVWLIILPLM
ncbi:MAG: magnesium transporter [Clostridia bacterium]|nr:magnesium transporter [Clostridia bacterium]